MIIPYNILDKIFKYRRISYIKQKYLGKNIGKIQYIQEEDYTCIVNLCKKLKLYYILFNDNKEIYIGDVPFELQTF